MADITASMVKELREKSGAGMMDAKKALTEVNGDMDAAVDWLRKKGLATAEKKSSRTAAEGLVSVAIEGTRGAVVEVNAETDFVARNAEFQTFVKKVSEISLKSAKNDDIATVANASYDGSKTVDAELTALIAKIGEKMALRRVATLEVKDGVVVGYVHNAVATNMGKIGVLVALESTGDKAKLESLGKQIAMHVAAAFPQCLDRDGVDTMALDRERAVLSDQARASGKGEDIIAKMVEGRLRKYYEEVVLLEQIFVVDGETPINKILENAAKDVGAPIKLTAYQRFQLGEGIEVEQKDFAAEVAAVANG